MKYILAIAFCCIITLFACTKSSTGTSSLIGKWKQTEYLSDPGDGSGKWMTRNDDYFIEFTSDSIYQTSDPSFGDIIRFSLPNDSTIILIYSSGTSKENYKIEGNKLTLSGGCIEACGSKYIKQN